MGKSNRRNFLKISALAAAGASSGVHALNSFQPPSGQVKAWQTAGSQRFAPIEAPAWQTGGAAAGASIRLDPSQRYQDVLGFGAAYGELFILR